jgi:pyruvate formate lyase activating enzyme
LVKEEDILEYLSKNKKFLDGVVITGGEPTIQKGIKLFIKKVKDIGYEVKLDTNGSNPKLIENLISSSLVDFISMDVKAPLNIKKYSYATGITITEKILENIKKSINIIMNSEIDYEFRTTIVPVIHKKEDVVKISKYISNAKCYVLQQFVPQNTLDKEFVNVKPYDVRKLIEMKMECEKFVKQVILRY